MRSKSLAAAAVLALSLAVGMNAAPASAQAPTVSCNPYLQNPWDILLAYQDPYGHTVPSMGYCISFDGVYMTAGVKWQGQYRYPRSGRVELILRDTQDSTGHDQILSGGGFDDDIQPGDVIRSYGAATWQHGRYCARFIASSPVEVWEGYCIWV
jgi:hypothetical protein